MSVVEQLLHNKVLWISILAWAIAQCAKIIIDLLKSRKLDLVMLFSTGGMPSSHSAFVSSLAVTTGFETGFDSLLFAICTVLGIIVMYDAAGVRRAAGEHAVVLNTLIDFFEGEDIQIEKRLKELLGHRPIEVAAGALLGIIVAVLFR